MNIQMLCCKQVFLWVSSILFNAAHRVHHSPHVATSSSSGNGISTSKNDAYGIVHKETTTETSCKGADAVYEDVTTSLRGVVERIHVSYNAAYGTTPHPMNSDEYDYV